ncbi:MAG: ATP-binding protein [Gemmatimonadota bacterium]
MEPSGQARLAAAGVTAREAEVLAVIGGRLTNQEIAARLFISVRTVESHVSALLRKLGLPGRPALIELAQQLAAGPALPVPPTSFVGRDAELARLRELLAASQLVTLTGPAGCGKTRLALAAARAWPGETRVAELGPATAADASAVLAGALGISYEAGDLAVAARVALAGRDLLIVADNCDHVITAAGELLTALTRAVPGLRIIATSRQPLGVSEEHVLPVPPLAGPADARPASVAGSAAGRLFLDRAQAAAPEFRLDAVTAPHVAAICRRLDGLPLAIELAAARARSLDVAALADSLTDQVQLLAQPGGAGRHRSLAAAIEWSWQLLDETERDLLSRLAALPGEFTLALAEAVTPGLAAGGLRAALLRLADRSLVSVLLGGGPARYRLLGVIRAFVAGRAPGPAAEVRRAHAHYFSALAAADARAHCQPATAGPPAAEGPPFDEVNYLAALAWAADAEPPLADRLLTDLSQLIEVQPSRRAIEAIRAVAERTGAQWSSEALARAGLALTYLDLAGAAELARRAASRAASDRDRGYARWVTGWLHAYRRQESAALESLDQVIAYAGNGVDPWLEASAWQGRGLARTRTADAFADWERAVTAFVVAGDLAHASNVRYFLASRAVEAGERLADVPVWLRECEAYAGSRGWRHELAHIHRVQAVYERMQGRPAEARGLLERCLPVFRQAGDFRCTARTLLELGAHHREGEPAAAADLLLQGLGMAMIAGDGPLRARILAALTRAAAAAGDLPLAARAFGTLSGEQPAGSGDDTLPAELVETLRAPAYATFVAEGRAGGPALLGTRYPRLPAARSRLSGPARRAGGSGRRSPPPRAASTSAGTRRCAAAGRTRSAPAAAPRRPA